MKLSKAEGLLVSDLVALYVERKHQFDSFIEQLRPLIQNSPALKPLVHSLKWRVKDPTHLKDKLARKTLEAKEQGNTLDIDSSNLFSRINDLAGFRILHLYTQQFEGIKRGLDEILAEAQYKVIEGPIAKTWDDESRRFFTQLGVETEVSGTMYTSVHYVIEMNSKTKYTAEIQVRTLMEEVWGEVDHTINYPAESKSLSCREQIASLARITSGCTRLVDSIFRSHADWKSSLDVKKRRQAKALGAVRKPVAKSSKVDARPKGKGRRAGKAAPHH